MREDWSMETTVLLISLAIIPVLLAMAILCLRIHKTSKSNPDLFGTVGTVKSKETDESFTTSAGSGQDKLNVSGEERGEVRTPSYDRKLPELPSDEQYKGKEDREQYKGKEDSNSELYATVDEMPNNNNTVRLPGLGQRAGGVSLVPESHHPYAQVKKQRRQEHPYAKVGEVGGPPSQEDDEEDDTEEYDTADHLQLPPAPAPPGVPTTGSGRGRGTWVPPPTTEGRGTWVPPPNTEGRGTWVPPPRRPEDNRGRGGSRQTTPLPPEPGPEIHFSGDSQDSFSAKGYTSISVREPLANLSRPPLALEGNYVTLSETSDEMYAAIEETVYTHPGGAAGGVEGGADMYSKVDKAKKRGKSLGAEERPAYATVSKGGGVEQGEVLGARPKQRSPCPPHPPSEGVDYSEYEVAHSDSRARMNRSYHKSYPSGRDPGYETVPYSESGLSEKEPGYEVVPQGRGKSLGSRDPEYETLASETRDPGYETLAARDRVNSLDPGYETVPQKRREPGYASLLERDQGRRLDPGYETVSGAQRTGGGGGAYTGRSFPPGDYESVQPREPGYETLEEGRRREDNYRSLEPGYEELPEVRRDLKDLEVQYSRDLEVQYSRVNKKAARAAPPHRSPPRPRLYSGSEVNYETLPEPKTGGRGGGASDEGGYETIPASERLQYETMQPSERLQYETIPPSERLQYDPGYETLPAMRLPPSEPGYETIPGGGVRVDDLVSEGTTDPDYARLKDADIEFIDDSADELDDELGRLQTDEDVTVESSQSSSLIHMSVVESGHGVRRSSVVVIEHVDMTPVPSRASEGGSETDMDVNTHIFV